MHDATSECEERFAGIAVAPVLFNGVSDRLLGQAVLELESRDGKPVNKQAEIKRPHGFIATVAELPRHAEAIFGVECNSLLIAGVRCGVERRNFMRPMLEATSQDVDHATPTHFTR